MIETVFILTKRFPYDPPMEAPLSEELEYWASSYSGQVFLVPKRDQNKEMWDFSKKIKIAQLPKKWKQPVKIFRIMEALCSSIFIRELLYLFFNKKETRVKFYKSAYAETYEVFIYKRKLKTLIDQHKTDSLLIYSYWFNQIAYSAALLKKQYPALKVVARAVSKDLYEFRNPNNYLPIKRQLKGKLDAIYTISKEGKTYMKSQYNFSEEELTVSRKGIRLPSGFTLPSKQNHITIVSIAVFKPLKRIDKIIDAISLLAKKHTSQSIEWHHLGGVVLKRMEKEEKKLRNLAQHKLAEKNICYHFHGTLPHSKVLAFLSSQSIDVIVNASETEGVPLSIMEAMARGIPAIAPDVGGIAELVQPPHGILLNKNPDTREIAEALSKYSFYKDPKIRKKAQKFIADNFNIAINYPQFISELTEK